MKAGRARVRSELLAETNGPYTTSELSYFLVLSCESGVLSFPSVGGPQTLALKICHAERNREERVAVLTMESKHPYPGLRPPRQ